MTSPLVTFAIYAFNEEAYIRQAIDAALAQDYSPLEIILSDDGSADRTFSIMEEMAASYCGPHRIFLNRNPRNIGIGSQLNSIFQKSRGELIILANGDDISNADRVERTVSAWLASGRQAHAITTDLATMDQNGQILSNKITTDTIFRNLEDGVRKRFGGVGAASLALSRDVFERFGPLLPTLILEDNALYLRAALLGERVHLWEPLVTYRIHPGNISQAYTVEEFSAWEKRHRERTAWSRREGVKAYLQMLNDLYSEPADAWPERDLKRARWVALEKLAENAILRDYYTSDRAVTRGDWWQTLYRLAQLLFKLAIKVRIPAIEHRNTRWHFRQLQCEMPSRVDRKKDMQGTADKTNQS